MIRDENGVVQGFINEFGEFVKINPNFGATTGAGGGTGVAGFSLDDEIALIDAQNRGRLAEQQEITQRETELAKEQAQSSQAVARINGDFQQETARINADTQLAVADKQKAMADAQARATVEAARVQAETEKYNKQLDVLMTTATNSANLAIAAGNIQLGMAQIASAEKMQMVQAQLQRESQGLQAYISLMQLQEQAKTRRAESAASIFNTIAQMAPQENLRSAFYLLRGQAPPEPFTSRIPKGLFEDTGLNPDTVEAARQTVQGSTTVPPWMIELMGGTTGQPTPGSAANPILTTQGA